MTNIELLTSQVEQYPTNPIVSSMLVDELMEARDMNRSEAEACVMRVAEVAIDAAFMRRAAEIISGCPWQRAWARGLIAGSDAHDVPLQSVVLLVPGLSAPTYHGVTQTADRLVWNEATVTVGAQWLVREYREYLAWMKIHKRELREAKRK